MCAVYVCDVTQNEILETIFSGQELHYNELVIENKLKVVMMIVNLIKSIYWYETIVSVLLLIHI